MIKTEDVFGIDFSETPKEIKVEFLGGIPVARIPYDTISNRDFSDLARAVVDLGWRHGARGATVSVRLNPQTRATELIIQVTYGTP